MSKKEEVVVQQIVGHLIDTHVCEETCDELKDIDEEDDDMVVDNEDEGSSNKNSDASNCVSITPIQNSNISMTMTSEGLPNNYNSSSNKTTNNYLAKAPVLFTTNIPISHCLTDKSKYAVQFRQKSRQIASLKLKLGTLTKKIEELENKCVVQERQLSYPFIKRLKTIRKNASKGDPCATYILEQIRCYTGKTKMRWSDTTLTQCAIWCRKAPYAYEYFKKAEFFKLPCLGTVKRYMKKHPEIRNQNKINPLNPDESESSSDFDFDESDSDKEGQGHSDDENMEPTTTCETMLCDSQVVPSTEQSQMIVSNQIFANSTQIIPNSITPIQQEELIQNDPGSETSKDGEKSIELSSFPMTMDTSNLIQEIILPSGEVMQCYTSSLCNGNDASERIISFQMLETKIQEWNRSTMLFKQLNHCQLFYKI
ncbi:THAP-type domain-containing protein [Caerostris extrusa]|uniref:THAP-type domain-containing protein n=1 Tax=Caerostris extrusa TaxID=172846 RepID=A0AAV4SL73_CAEEX|nr:THAP-type domain-containing protein [Caerostris extrusa]